MIAMCLASIFLQNPRKSTDTSASEFVEIPTEIFMASQPDHRILMKDIMFMVGHAETMVATTVELCGNVVVVVVGLAELFWLASNN